MNGVLVPTVSEADWADRRRGGVTASEIAVLMGLSPYSSPFELYYRKTGELPGQPDSDAMAIGRAMENFVADQFGRRHPEFWLRGSGRELWQHPARPWQMATPDRTVYDNCGSNPANCPEHGDPLATLECKVDNGDGFGDDGTDEIPVHYRCQVLWQMDVLGVATGYVAALIWHKRQVRIYELTMDDQAQGDLDLMRHEARMFLRRIARRDPPEPDWRPATTAALKRLHPSLDDRDVVVPASLAKRYRAACAAVNRAGQRKALAENQIRERLGSGRRAVDGSCGQPVARRDVYDLPEKTITRKAATVDRLVPVAPKEKP